MTSVPTYLVDPYLLQQPSPGEWQDAARSILAWTAEDAREAWQFILPAACVSRLIESGNVPYFDAHGLHAILRSQGESSIPALDLHRQVNRLLARAQYAEPAVLSDSVEVTPQVIVSRQCADQIQRDFPCWLVAVYLTQELHQVNRSLCAASRPGDGLYEEARVSVRGHVLEAEGVQRQAVHVPGDVSFDLAIFFRPVATSLDPASLIADPVWTLRQAYAIQVPQADRELYPLREFSIHPNFVPSIQAFHLENTPEVLRVIIKQAVRVLSGQEARFPRMQVHPQRTGLGPSDPQLTRPGGAVAYRLHLTKRGPGYRLLYWVKGSTYELWEVRTESG